MRKVSLFGLVGLMMIGWILRPEMVYGAVNCDFTISTNRTTADARIDYTSVGPGDTVCIVAGSRSVLNLKNFRGADNDPITFINSGGQVVISSSGSNGIAVHNSQHIRITGTGVSGYQYGIKIIRSAGVGINAGHKSSNLEIDHVEVTGADGQGITAKTEPVCSDGSTTDWKAYDYDNDGITGNDKDDVVNRSNFTQYDTRVHDNYIHDVGTEALYIGGSFYSDGVVLSCNSGSERVYEPVLRGVRVFNNTIKNTGWDGGGVGSAVEDCEVYQNHTEATGLKKRLYQEVGWDIKTGSECDSYNNWVKDSGATGISIFANRGNRIYNNVIINAGVNKTTGNNEGNGITIWKFEENANGSDYVWNNTIISPHNFGIKFAPDLGTDFRFENNIIVNPGNYGWDNNPYIRLYGSAPVTVSHNITQLNNSGLNFGDPPGDDYSLTGGSKAIDTGVNLAGLGITFDYARVSRPQGGGFDIGAYEYVSSAPTPTLEPGCYLSSGLGTGNSGGDPGWDNYALSQDLTSDFTAEFEVTPLDNQTTGEVEGLVAFSQDMGSYYSDYAMLFRLNPEGFFDVRNGGAYQADQVITFSPDSTYKVRLVASLGNHTYSVWVTPSGQGEQLLANNYSFRIEQATVNQIGNWGTWSRTGRYRICGMQPMMIPTPTPMPINWQEMLINWLTEMGDRNQDGKVNSWDWTLLNRI
jgi:hypothetical protein